jgi:ArsR family transcriptional regulator
MTQSAVSHQLRLMREMRLVKSRKDGRMVHYTLDDEHIHDLFRRGLEHTEHQ